MKIAVIVDDLRQDRRRRCFWERSLHSFPNVELELTTLSKQIDIDQQQYHNLHAYDCIIFNWDVINNDPMFSSDRSYLLVKGYSQVFAQYVQNGGILIVENQSWHWYPVQEAYNALFYGHVTVSKNTMLENVEAVWSSMAQVSQKHKKHPLVHNLPKVLHSAYPYGVDVEWFPPGSVSPLTLQWLNPTKMYSGAFRKWHQEWFPLIYTDDNKFPILLVKTDGLGLWVVSTMFLASSNITTLIENLVLKAKGNLPLIKQYHSHFKLTQAFYAFRAIALLILIVFILYEMLTLHVITIDIPFSNSLGGNIVISLLITCLFWIMSKLFSYIWSSIRLAINK